jgi:serine/threonine protein phosphatase PrpC
MADELTESMRPGPFETAYRGPRARRITKEGAVSGQKGTAATVCEGIEKLIMGRLKTDNVSYRVICFGDELQTSIGTPLFDTDRRTIKGDVREKTEDRQVGVISQHHLFHPDRVRRLGYAFVLADGVGGENLGEYAAGAATRATLSDYYSNKNPGKTIQERMDHAFRRADQAVKEEGDRYRQRRMATTLTMLVVTPDGKKAVVANAGSDVIMKISDEGVKQLTVTDSWVDEQRRRGLLTAEEAASHSRRNIITNCITASRNPGESESFKRGIHYNVVDINPGDTFLMCSDGLTEKGVLSIGELAQLTRQSKQRPEQIKSRKTRPERPVRPGQARTATGKWIENALTSPVARAIYATTTFTTLTALTRGDIPMAIGLTASLHGIPEGIHWLVNRTAPEPPKVKTPQPARVGGKR